jgi:2-oxoglutarate dehydrogenase E2 component (dihydrolipoamide succinyltransferase)
VPADDAEGETAPPPANARATNGAAARPANAPALGKPQLPGEKPAGRAFVSPVVRRLVAEHHVDLTQVAGSGLGGRVTRQDLLAYLEEMERSGRPPAAPEALAGEAPLAEDELLHPLSTMRRAIAQHMVKSKQTAPHVTTIFEVDMTAVVRHREANKQAAAARGLPLTLTPYLVAAAAQALRETPAVNSRYSEQGIIESRRVHIGVAVSLPAGLLVPVVRNADELTLAGLARAVADLAERARSGSLGVDEVSGATFTITNHGVSGSLIGTPIIAQPQSAILGVGAVVKRPVVVSLPEAGRSLLPGPGDAIVIRPMAYLSLTFDHRLLDGATADGFLASIKRTLEGWPEGGL